MPAPDVLDPVAFSGEVIALLEQRFDLRPPIAEPVLHLLHNPGKCLRPELAFAVADACGRQQQAGIFAVAAAAELLHVAALVHDDLVDEAETRHGADSVNRRFGIKAAVLAGDYLIGAAHALLAADASEPTVRSVGPAMHLLAEAELTELLTRGNDLPTDLARRIAVGKAGTLFAWVATATAIECREWAGESAWHGWGLQLGLLYQLSNDIGDRLGINEGKDLGKNLETDTPTLLQTLLNQPEGTTVVVQEIERLCETVKRPPALGPRLAAFISFVASQAEERSRLLQHPED